MGDSPLIFVDYTSSRAVTGLEEVAGFEDTANLDQSERERFYEGVPLHDLLRSFTARLNDLVGLDILGFDLGMWSWQPGSDPQNFMLMRGPFDREKIAGKLLDLDYKKAEYKGAVYYWLYEDLRVDRRHPLSRFGLPINRIAFAGDWLLAASAGDTFESLIGVRNEEALSLLASKRHIALADAVGDGLLGGAFMTPQWIVENWNKVSPGPVARLDRYLEGPDRWGLLSSYTQALFGYRVQGDLEQTVIALYYPDPSAAEKDARELKRRWNSFFHHPFVDPETEIPVARSYAPLSTTAITGAGSSILVGACPVIRSADRDPTVAGPGLWLALFNHRELQFLVPDLAELREQ